MSIVYKKLVSQHVTIFICYRGNHQDATKSGRFDEVVDSKTFFTIVADGDGEPRTTLQSQAEHQALQYLEDSDRVYTLYFGQISIGPLLYSENVCRTSIIRRN